MTKKCESQHIIMNATLIANPIVGIKLTRVEKLISPLQKCTSHEDCLFFCKAASIQICMDILLVFIIHTQIWVKYIIGVSFFVFDRTYK
jgi:hypothetical protein